MPFAKRLTVALALLLASATALAYPATVGSGARSDDASETPANAAALLRESISAPRLVSYVGQFETVRFSSNRADATIVRVEHRAPSLTRRWYLAPEALYGDYTITRGIATYEFDTKNSRLTVWQNPALDDQIATSGNFDRVAQNYRAVVDGDETVADRPTISIVLVNKYTGERAMRVWIDRDTHLVLKKEEYHANGSVASQTRFEELRYTQSIPDDIFSTAAPAGYEHLAGPNAGVPSADIDQAIKAAGFSPIEPKDLPQGFSLIGADATTVGGVRTLHFLYSDGLRSISLFENPTGSADFGNLRPKTIWFEGHDAQYVEDGPTTLLTWKEHGLYFALVGDLLRPELVEIAISVVP